MSTSEQLVGQRYRLIRRIAAGGMGSVWEAWDERLQRRVALKQVHPQPGLDAEQVSMAAERAMREARLAARLHHPNAVPIFDVVDDDGQPCIVMQYVPSRSLQSLLQERGALPPAQVARIGIELAQALAAAHAVGIVHRDVKPANVLITEDGSSKLTDFGIAHAVGDATLTSTGMVTGTPAYLAPEVARGETSTAAADVFSLGSTLYTAVEGRSPFGGGENPMRTLHRVAVGDIDPPTFQGGLMLVVQRMLAAEPAQRPTMAEVGDLLSSALRETQIPAAATTPTPHSRATAPVPDATRQLARGAPAAQTVSIPPARPAGRRRRVWPLLVAMALVALVGVGIAAMTLSRGGSSASSGPSTSPRAGGPVAGQRSTSTHSSSQTTARRSPTPTTTSPPSGGAGQQLIAAVRGYYALLPGDTADAWNRLTTNYQHSPEAGGRADYDAFWQSIASVSVSNETVDGNTVQADVSYVSRNGNSSSERRSFTLVDEGGVIKIDESHIVG